MAFIRALETRGMGLFAMEGDGNCLFRSVADQVYGDQAMHRVVRAKCVEYMRSQKTWFEEFIPTEEWGGIDAYLDEMARNGTWGDDPEVQAMCELY